MKKLVMPAIFAVLIGATAFANSDNELYKCVIDKKMSKEGMLQSNKFSIYPEGPLNITLKFLDKRVGKIVTTNHGYSILGGDSTNIVEKFYYEKDYDLMTLSIANEGYSNAKKILNGHIDLNIPIYDSEGVWTQKKISLVNAAVNCRKAR